MHGAEQGRPEYLWMVPRPVEGMPGGRQELLDTSSYENCMCKGGVHQISKRLYNDCIAAKAPVEDKDTHLVEFPKDGTEFIVRKFQ